MSRRVLYAGRFDIAKVDQAWQAGANPSHHLHAVPELRHLGFDVDVFGTPPGQEVGTWQFQRQLRRAARGYDAVIAHGLVEVNALAALGAAGLFTVPIVAFVHSVSARSLQKLTGRGAHRLLVLNHKAMDALRAAGVPERRLSYFAFGADLSFYQPRPAPTEFILSVGVSQRDHGTLIQAAQATGLPVVIVGKLDEPWAQAAAAPGSTVTVMSQGQYDLSFEQLLDLYNRARLVVVNHHGSDHPFGLNGIVEAMAMAKPVVLTRGAGIDIDPGALGFGETVPAHDAAALGQAMQRLFHTDEASRQALGARARAWAESTYNSRRMAADIARALDA